MTLKIVNGDIFDPKLEEVNRVIVHGCNAQGVMGSGIAKTIRDMYPEVYEDYKTIEGMSGLYLGDVVHSYINPELMVVSAITQETYGRNKNIQYVEYNAVGRALATITSIYKDREIHIPFIGGGLANGDKEILMQIFEEVFEDSDATLFIKD